MTIETATDINQLDPTYPEGSSSIAQGDDAIRLVKACLVHSLPGIGGPMTLTHTQLNALSRAILTADGAGLTVPAVASRANKIFAFGASGGVDVSLSYLDLQNSINVALGGSNYKGQWSSLTGPLALPASVYHNDTFWVLLNSLPNVAASQPGVTADWSAMPTGLINIQTFSAPGAVTYTKTPGTRFVIVYAEAAGGGTGGLPATSASQVALCGGGAGGAFGCGLFRTGFNGATVTVGAGGAAGAPGSLTAGGNGGATSFGALLTCQGGNGATGLVFNSSTDGIRLGGDGGTTVSGANISQGGGDQGGIGLWLANLGGIVGGNGGRGGQGIGRGGAGGTAGSGQPGTGAGSGAGGAARTVSSAAASGVAGTNGKVVVWEFS